MAGVRKYNEEQVREAMIIFWLSGNKIEDASERTGIPQSTIKDWVYKTRVPLFEEIKREHGAELTKTLVEKNEAIQVRLLEAVGVYADMALERSKNPRDIKSPSQEAQRLALTYAILFDKAQLARNRPTEIHGSKRTDPTDMLNQLRGVAPWLFAEPVENQADQPVLIEAVES